MATESAVRSRAGKLQNVSAMEIESTPLQDSSSSINKPLLDPQRLSSISYALDIYSSPLVLESRAAFKALTIVPLIVWWTALVAGMWAYEGLPKGQKVYHPMLWFDRGIVRPAGPLVPFLVLLIRAAIHGADYVLRHGISSSVAAARSVVARATSGAVVKRPGVKLGTLLVWCLVIYVMMAVARAGIYLTHWFLLTNRFLEYHIVSDHIFLAATMLICLHTEIICIMSDILRAVRPLQPSSPRQNNPVLAMPMWREVLLVGLFVVALFLYLFTVADMYYTARYYHFPMEVFFTTVVVFAMFQLPMVVWLMRQRRFRAEG